MIPTLGTTISATSPRPILCPASSLIFSMRCINVVLLTIELLSYPVTPRSAARMITIGMATSIQLTRMPCISLVVSPVGKREPHFDPTMLEKLRRIGAAVPGTPSIC